MGFDSKETVQNVCRHLHLPADISVGFFEYILCFSDQSVQATMAAVKCVIHIAGDTSARVPMGDT